ncbi:Lrp/AsnC family transcriptional regulator [Pseudothioclava arenosa]|uniref:AsnC family transcriptional regulator n=1 Tax=Pseudothioclava arenosa TaxID=1795308 RepID=A0A2A4CU08_9RHOB|nr:Lrp/AsnC family transcriptional regulator [Pseudothioclava arenosa]PCD77768.1 AsnC family transcriptional regulator [Pseudothioclava arenosa]
MLKLDETDLKILRVMQSDGSLTVSQIAERVGLSQSPCSRRIAQLQEAGVIVARSVLLDRRKLGFKVDVVTRIKLKSHDKATLEAFKKEIRAMREVQTAVLLLGEFDFHMRLVVRDIDHYQQLLQERLSVLPGVQEIKSSVILEVVKNTSALPL